MQYEAPNIPPDDLSRPLLHSQPDKAGSLAHIGLVGGTYTITVPGADTNGRFCVIDMYVPPGGGPPLHRHDFEETFIILEGEVEATFRGQRMKVKAGETINVPANAPHRFQNVSGDPVRLICICSPAGPENYFIELGVPVATRTTPPPALTDAEQARFVQKVVGLAPKYRTELVRGA
jgi:mannose-6-phosphate isomerase-like protein (cupin superfamily)